MRARQAIVLLLLAIAGLLSSTAAFAQELQPIDVKTLAEGAPAFPLIWRPYRPATLPQIGLGNGPRLAARLAGDRLELSLHDFLQLVVENDLDLSVARLGTAIAHVDLLRATAGQAARGTPDAPLPGALFAGAIGAGVSTTAALSAGGTGGAAITTQGKLFTLTPRGNFDPQFSANFSYDRVVSPLNTQKVAGVPSVTVPSTVLQTRFQQELAEGTSYAVSLNLQRQTSTQAGLLFNPALTSFLAMQVYQPLLNGFGLALNRRFITFAENERKMVIEAFHTTLNNTLANAADAYWDLVALRGSVRVAEQAVAVAEQQYDENRQRMELKAMTPLDVLSSESQLASSRVVLLAAQNRMQQQEIVVKTLISRTSDPALDAATIEPTEDLPSTATVALPPLAESVEKALAGRASIRQAQLALTNQRMAQQFTRNNLLPTFSVYAAFDAYGLAGSTSPAIRQLWRAVTPEYSVGFTLSIPVFNRAAQADDVRARLESQESEIGLERTRSQIRTQVHAATVSLSQGRAQIESAQRAVTASQEVFEGAQTKLRAGVGTPYQVTLASRDLTTAQSAEIQARVDFAKALIAHELAVGNLLDSHGIVFDQALNEHLAAKPSR